MVAQTKYLSILALTMPMRALALHVFSDAKQTRIKYLLENEEKIKDDDETGIFAEFVAEYNNAIDEISIRENYTTYSEMRDAGKDLLTWYCEHCSCGHNPYDICDKQRETKEYQRIEKVLNSKEQTINLLEDISGVREVSRLIQGFTGKCELEKCIEEYTRAVKSRRKGRLGAFALEEATKELLKWNCTYCGGVHHCKNICDERRRSEYAECEKLVFEIREAEIEVILSKSGCRSVNYRQSKRKISNNYKSLCEKLKKLGLDEHKEYRKLVDKWEKEKLVEFIQTYSKKVKKDPSEIYDQYTKTIKRRRRLNQENTQRKHRGGFKTLVDYFQQRD